MHPQNRFNLIKAINNPESFGGSFAGRRILPQFSNLIQEIRKLLLNHSAQQVRAAFGQAESTLFECAEHAENNQVQQMFFESIREVREQHIVIERAFLQNIAQKFDDFINGKIKTDSTKSETTPDQLALVQADDFEESLLVTSMSNKVSERCNEALYGIEQRLAVVNAGKKPGDSNPLSPTVIANSFYTALTESSFNLQEKTILYMLFEQFVMRELDQFYATINQQFISAGVLPNLKYSLARSSAVQTDAQQSAPNPAQTESAAQRSATAASHSPIDKTQQQPSTASSEQNYVRSGTASHQVETITALLNSYRQHMLNDALPDGVPSIAAYAPSHATGEYSDAQLLQSIAQLQKHTAAQTADHFTIQTVENIKNSLSAQLKALNSEAEHLKIAEQQANMIDLVGMLFNFIIEDASLSETSKTILSNLHSLYLQVALQDPTLFTQHQHPARKLLNEMAQAGVHYFGANEESALQQKMQFTVNQALRTYQGDNTLFEQLAKDFNIFVAALAQRVELREKRAIEAAKGRDKLLVARNQARALVDSTIKEFTPPGIIRNFLQNTWVDVLVFAFLRHGPASKQWQRYAAAAQQLAWSGTLLESTEEQQRFQDLRSDLLEELRKGLNLLGSYHPDIISKLLQDIIACQEAVRAQETARAEQINSEIPDSPLGAMLGEEQPSPKTPAMGNLSDQAQEIAYTLEHIDFGTWFEFDSPPATLKLSWFSPTTRNYMFVDSSGQRVAIKPLTTLAVEIEQGVARIITEDPVVPLMDRALSAIQKIFQRFNYAPS